MKELSIYVKSNCQNCIHCNVCKFRQRASEFRNDDLMYKMFEYLESNNLLDIFDENASRCKHYAVVDKSALLKSRRLFKEYSEIVGEEVNSISDSDGIIKTRSGKEYSIKEVNSYITFEF